MFTVTECSSASVELSTNGEQSLVAFVPGGIVPVQVSVTVCPAVVGTVTLLVGGVDAPTGPTAKRSMTDRTTAPKAGATFITPLPLAAPTGKAGLMARTIRVSKVEMQT